MFMLVFIHCCCPQRTSCPVENDKIVWSPQSIISDLIHKGDPILVGLAIRISFLGTYNDTHYSNKRHETSEIILYK